MDQEKLEMAKKIIANAGGKGKIDQEKFKQMMHDAVSKQTTGHLSPRTRLKIKLGQLKSNRLSSTSRVLHDQKKEDNKKESIEKGKRLRTNKKKRHRKKLAKLKKELGKIDDETYMKIIDRMKDPSVYKTEHEMQKDKYILELYEKQEGYDNKIDMNQDLDFSSDDETC